MRDLLKLGWPAEDLAGYVDGEAHAKACVEGLARGVGVWLHRRDGFKAAPASVAKMKELCDAYEMQFIIGQVTGLEEQDEKLTGVKLMPQSLPEDFQKEAARLPLPSRKPAEAEQDARRDERDARGLGGGGRGGARGGGRGGPRSNNNRANGGQSRLAGPTGYHQRQASEGEKTTCQIRPLSKLKGLEGAV